MFSGPHYCDRCGRDCNCPPVVVIAVDSTGGGTEVPVDFYKPFIDELPEDPHWREQAWAEDDIPTVHMAVERAPRREYQTRRM